MCNAILLSEKKKKRKRNITTSFPATTFYKYTLSEKPTKTRYSSNIIRHYSCTPILQKSTSIIFQKAGHGMTRVKKKKKYGATKNRFLLFFFIRPLFTQLLKTREETLQNIILVFSLPFLKIIIHPLLFHLCPSRLRVQINFRDRETMKNRTTGRRRPGLGGINYVVPNDRSTEGEEDKTSAKLGRSNDSTLFFPLD